MTQWIDFSGKQVWVTGAGQGIGAAIASEFQRYGAIVTGFDVQFAQPHYDYATAVVDIRDASQVAEVCQAQLLMQRTAPARLDILVNAAGILRLGGVASMSAESWEQCLAVNAGGAFNLFQQTLPLFRQQRYGSIVTVASNAAHVPRVGMAAYGASKAALRSLCHTVALEMAEFGVRCNLVSPGSTDTAMQRALWKDAQGEVATIRGFPQQHKLGIPLGKIARPQDIADAVLFLASDRAAHITMQDLVVDGGATLGA
jgi:2,3-dihydro-2,3-dihydroxybenzoate dehydrogenase